MGIDGRDRIASLRPGRAGDGRIDHVGDRIVDEIVRRQTGLHEVGEAEAISRECQQERNGKSNTGRVVKHCGQLSDNKGQESRHMIIAVFSIASTIASLPA